MSAPVSAVRDAVYEGFFRLGLVRLFQWANRGKVPILYYHGVTDRPADGTLRNLERNHLDRREFSAQIAYLAGRYRVLPLAELAGRMARGEPIPPRCAAVTFDDGYENNYLCAYPVLKEFGVPATLFIATDFVKNRRLLWVDRVEMAFSRTKEKGYVCPLRGREAAIDSPERARRAYLETKAALKKLDADAREKAVSELWRRLLPQGTGDPDPDYAPLTREQLREMSASGLVEIGAHSVRHSVLTALPSPEARWEIEQSAADVEELTGKRPRFFAYPNGACSAELEALVRGAGYEAACAVGLRLNDPVSPSLFSLPRITLASGDTPALFAATLCGLRGALTRAKCGGAS